jgi:4-alpha-glucanotransferase
MNTPGKESGNWRWRMLPEHLQPRHFALAGEFTEVYGRENDGAAVL